MDDQLVTIKSFSLPWETELPRATLEAQGIPAFVADAYTVGINWLYSNAIGGVKLQVPETFVEAASKTLASQPEPSPSDSQEKMDAPIIRRGRRWTFLAWLLAILTTFAMLPPEVDITGDWHGEMVGTILYQGNTQHNNIALSLEQVGDQVSGTFVFLDGPTLEAPVEGLVSGRKFTFTAETVLDGSCRVYVEASLVVAETGQSMSGEKRLEHCDGTAVGKISVARLGSEWTPPEIQGIPEPPPLPPAAR